MNTFLDIGKHYIECKNLSALQQGFQQLREEDVGTVDWPWLFQKLYLHACLKGCKEIAIWLEKDVFPTMDPIQQIALRQGFAYGRHLLRTSNHL